MAHPLREYRSRNEMTLAELAEKVGSSKFILSRIETGKQDPDLDLLRTLIEVTGITADAFLAAEKVSGATPAEECAR